MRWIRALRCDLCAKVRVASARPRPRADTVSDTRDTTISDSVLSTCLRLARPTKSTGACTGRKFCLAGAGRSACVASPTDRSRRCLRTPFDMEGACHPAGQDVLIKRVCGGNVQRHPHTVGRIIGGVGNGKLPLDFDRRPGSVRLQRHSGPRIVVLVVPAATSCVGDLLCIDEGLQLDAGACVRAASALASS